MYSNKFVIVLCAVGIVKANDDWKKRVVYLDNSYNTFRVIDSIHQEYPCISQGGICTIAADCPESHLVEEKGLCPVQRRRGVECCYGLSVKETRCEKRGGQCLEDDSPCSKALLFKNATDCPKGTNCCILVQ